MSVQAYLDALSTSDRARLQFAFELHQADYIRVGADEFVGVNVDTISNLLVTERAGSFSIGKVVK